MAEQEAGQDQAGADGPRIVIVGAGPGGLCMGIRLKAAGFHNFVLLEKSHGVGGTWNHNRYPGCAVDLPSFLYSFSFEKKFDWSRPYAPQPELLAYMEGVAEKYELLPHCRFGQEVAGAHWDESASEWSLKIAGGGEERAQIVVSAIGMFNELVYPDLPGADTFAGRAFHSARWDWNHDLAGRRVAVIGSAASAVQIVPEIIKTAKQVHLFQRTANWVMPKEDEPYTKAQLAHFQQDPSDLLRARDEMFVTIDEGMTFNNSDLLAEMEKAGDAIREQVRDPETRAKLKPTHPYGCKRPLVSNLFYPAFNEDNLELVTDPIEQITSSGVQTRDGTLREVDTLVFATGFRADKYLSALDVRGRGGQRIDDAWSDGAEAHLGITTAGFPNLFMLYGPNTNNGSILQMIEYQTTHVCAHVERIAREGLAWVDVQPDAMAAYNEKIQKAIDGVSVWNESCNGYYRSASGRVVTQWPFSMTEFREMTETLNPEDYEVGI